MDAEIPFRVQQFRRARRAHFLAQRGDVRHEAAIVTSASSSPFFCAAAPSACACAAESAIGLHGEHRLAGLQSGKGMFGVQRAGPAGHDSIDRRIGERVGGVGNQFQTFRSGENPRPSPAAGNGGRETDRSDLP